MAMKLPIERDVVCGYTNMVFESDNTELVWMMNKGDDALPRDHVGMLCNKMKMKVNGFIGCKVNHCKREQNEKLTLWLRFQLI